MILVKNPKPQILKPIFESSPNSTLLVYECRARQELRFDYLPINFHQQNQEKDKREGREIRERIVLKGNGGETGRESISKGNPYFHSLKYNKIMVT